MKTDTKGRKSKAARSKGGKSPTLSPAARELAKAIRWEKIARKLGSAHKSSHAADVADEAFRLAARLWEFIPDPMARQAHSQN